MTVANNYTPPKYAGNGVTVNFTFIWKAILDTDVKVYIEENNVQTLKTLGVDYTLVFNTDNVGGTITFGTAPTSSQFVIIARETDYTQGAEYKTSSGFDAVKVENSFDKNCILIQQLLEQIGRQIQVPLGTTIDNELPAPVAEALIGYNNTADGFALYTSLPDSVITNPVALSYLRRNSGNTSYDSLTVQNVWDDILGNTTVIADVNSNLPEAAQGNKGIIYANKYWMWGLIPSSNGTTPDEQVDITPGRCIAQDGETFLELTSTETGLDFTTLNGGALSVSTTYHLFRYLKNDDTMQWHLDTSLTPTISDIKSASAYRRIYSAITDSSGDLPDVVGNILESGIGVEYLFKDSINIETAVTATASQTIITLPLATGLKFYAQMIYAIQNSDSNFQVGRMYSLDTNDVAVTAANGNLWCANTTSTDNDGSIELKVRTNTSAQIARRENTGAGTPGDIYTTIIGYLDYRNQF
jgi:hypothetical protein